MRDRLVAAALLTLFALSDGPAPLGGWLGSAFCACSEAVCCCAPRQEPSAHSGCRRTGARMDQLLKCRHSGPEATLRIPDFLLPQAAGLEGPAYEVRHFGLGDRGPRTGFAEIESPPPRPTASAS